VVEAGLLECADREIWDFAKRSGLAIVTTDADLCDLATTVGPPPKIIWLRRWTHPARDAEEVLRREAVRIVGFLTDPNLAVLVLDRR